MRGELRSPTSMSVRYFTKSQARSGFFEPLEMPRPWLLGVAQLPGICAAPSVSPLIHGPLPLIQKKAGAWACSMPTLPVAKASLGSTQRPVHEIGLMAPLLVASASLVEHLGRLGRVEGRLLEVGRQQVDAVHLHQRPVQPVEVERQQAGLLAALDLVGGGEDLVEALRRLVDARLLEARLVPEQQRLGDVVGHHVVLVLEHPVREIGRRRSAPLTAASAASRGVRSSSAPWAAYSRPSAPWMSMTSGGVPAASWVW